HQMNFTTMAGILGGNVRVGLEDSLNIGRGALAKSNAEQVAKIRRILEELSLEIATPKEAREILKLKGGDRVGFSSAEARNASRHQTHLARRGEPDGDC